MTSEFGSPRTALVTGGAKRIGAALCRALAEDGWHVAIHCHRSRDEAQRLAAEPGNARVVVADLAAPDCAQQIFGQLGDAPPVALLVNNASRFDLDQFDDFDAAMWDAHFAPNVRAPALLTQALAARLRPGEGGLVVNLLDAKLAFPNPDFFTYTLSKAALAALTDLSARALAERGVRVCGIAPSITLVSGPQSRDNFEKVRNCNPLGRGVDVAEIVAALRFIVATPTLTGETIRLDGGQRFWGLRRDVQFLEE